MCCSFEMERTTEQTSDQSRGRPLRSLIAIGSAVIVAAAVAAAAMVAGASEPTHDITLIARDMAFYLPQNAQANPPLEVTREEQVRLTLVNRDAGIDHDLAVASLDVETKAIPGDGASDSVEFRAPREPGVHEYVCRLHGRMMRGQLTVR